MAEIQAARKRGPKGSGTSIWADLKDHPTLLDSIRSAAKADDRNVSNWLRRKLVSLDEQGLLVPTLHKTAELFKER